MEGLDKYQSKYVKKLLSHRKEKEISFEQLKSRYYRLISDDKIKQIFPIARFNKESGNYDLYLKMKKEREIIAQFGGNISNQPINEGFFGVQYNYLGRAAITLTGNTYFGKLYGSGQLRARLDMPNKLPFFIEGGFTINRWDFFKSSNTFFEDVKPSYLIQNEQYGDVAIGLPVNNKGKLIAGFTAADMKNEYYQNHNFSQKDTADITDFSLLSGNLQYERSSLNKKQYANEGSYFSVRARYIDGIEKTTPGSTSVMEKPFRGHHDWLRLKFIYDNYYKSRGHIKLGFYAEGVYSNQPFFNNYTGTILAAPAFTPISQTQTIFLEKFRAYRYVALGLKNVYAFTKNIDIRIEGYVFQPYQEIVKNNDLKADFGTELNKRYILATAALVGHTPVGPISLSLNYYQDYIYGFRILEYPNTIAKPFTFLFHFGYIIFNKRAVE